MRLREMFEALALHAAMLTRMSVGGFVYSASVAAVPLSKAPIRRILICTPTRTSYVGMGQ